MKFFARTLLAAAVALALVATVAAAPRPETTIEDVAPVNREVDGGLTTQAIWYVDMDTKREGFSCCVFLVPHLRMIAFTPYVRAQAAVGVDKVVETCLEAFLSAGDRDHDGYEYGG